MTDVKNRGGWMKERRDFDHSRVKLTDYFEHSLDQRIKDLAKKGYVVIQKGCRNQPKGFGWWAILKLKPVIEIEDVNSTHARCQGCDSPRDLMALSFGTYQLQSTIRMCQSCSEDLIKKLKEKYHANQ
jgi:hypothetical protein